MDERLLSELARLERPDVENAEPARLAEMLADLGVATTEDFARVLIDLVDAARSAEAGETVTDGSFDAIDEAGPGAAKPQHTPPRGQFHFRGDVIDPEDIRRFDGRPLHFTIVGTDPADTRLVAFETHREVRDLLRLHGLLEPLVRRPGQGLEVAGLGCVDGIQPRFEPGVPMEPPEGADPVGGYVTCGRSKPQPNDEALFCEHTDFDQGGNWFWLKPNRQIARLTDWRLSHGIFSGGRSWNDEISSIYGGDGMVIVWDDIDFQGSSLTIGGSGSPDPVDGVVQNPICGAATIGWRYHHPRQAIADLRDFGWNDRISSVQHWFT